MRWRCRLNVLWTAAWMLRKRWVDRADLNRCILRSRHAGQLRGRILGPCQLLALPLAVEGLRQDILVPATHPEA
jgi:hypothetical protein